jgi:ubiquinone biosynthesis accessory factor UbiK
MIEKSAFDDLGERLAQAARSVPAQDVEKNLRALLLAFFDRFELVPREDFEVQKKLIERAQAKLAALEARVAVLEAGAPRKPPT